MLISVSHLTKYNQLKCIVNDVSFAIEDHDKIALIGLNGSGKSTLLKIIAGIEDYQGTLLKKKDIRISYLPQTPDFQSHLTVLQQVYQYVGNDVEKYQIESILNQLGVTNHQQKIHELSGGQEKRVALAITLLKPCDLLLLDEPTNHLDNEMIEYLEKYLIKFNKALLMITHDRYFLERVTNKIFELDHQKIYEYQANYSLYLELKQQREEALLASQRKRKLFLKKELEWVRAGVQARATKSKDRLKRFEEMSQIKDIDTAQSIDMINIQSRLGRKTIELHDVSMSYDTLLFNPFTYHFKKNDRIGILGRNGCGKSTLLNIIAGIIQPTQGYVEKGETVKIGYFKQGYEDMDPQQKVIDYIKETAHFIQTSDGEISAKNMCERFLFDSSMQYNEIGRLSGGEKRRLYLLKILMQSCNVLLLDEPTNDLDITTLQILEDFLDSFNGIIITVSHDRYFLDRICDHVFVIKDQNIELHTGGYSQYIDISSTTMKKKTNSFQTYRQTKQKKIKLSYKENQEFIQLEKDLPCLEDNLKLLDEQMNETTDYQEIFKLTKQRDELLQHIEEANERYLELLEKKELS